MKSWVDKARYDRIADFYDLYEAPVEFFLFAGWRKLLFERIKEEIKPGQLVLEIGAGTGKNIPYYSGNYCVAFDISEKMIARARDRARGRNVDLLVADAEFMPFKDGVFDFVFATFVFCSVENPLNGLKEAHRVLKVDGRAFFLEHMLPESKILQPLFHFLNPLARMMGLEIDRRTVENIKLANFRLVKEEHLFTSVFRLIEAVKG